MKILIVEDDLDLATVLKMRLKAECFAVDVVSDGEKASYEARVNDYDLILLDHMLPNKQGRDICEEIRKAEKTTPILVLSAKGDARTKIDILNCGADDFVTKPFSYEELYARMKALLRRPRVITSPTIFLDTLEVDTARAIVRRDGKRIYLTRKEYALTEFLMRNKQNVVSRGMLLEHIWDNTHDPFSNTIEVHISGLRKKIDPPGQTKLLHTVAGRGYKLDIES